MKLNKEKKGKKILEYPAHGGVAQLGEHLLCKQGVIGSNPFISTSGEEVENLGTRIWAYSSAG